MTIQVCMYMYMYMYHQIESKIKANIMWMHVTTIELYVQCSTVVASFCLPLAWFLWDSFFLSIVWIMKL